MTKEETKETLAYRITSDEFVAVENKSNHRLIGNVYLGKREFDSLEIGYVFNASYWNHGYASESCARLMEEAFSNGIPRIYAKLAREG